MTEFLLFTLYAPLASWGDVAVGEVRGSWDRPGRSAVLGMVAAALGIRREEQERHDELDSMLGVAIRLDAPGRPLVDYHTAQTVATPDLRKRRVATRRELLNAVTADRWKTILSRRTYRVDALVTAALWVRGEARHSLHGIAEALRRPRFVLYAGRKSNPFGIPVRPQVVSARTLAEALSARDPLPPGMGEHGLRPSSGWGREVSHDPCTGFASGLEPIRREVRRDARPHRARWQFHERNVEVGHQPSATSGSTPEET